ncbi:MAG: methylated-DNA--[protein]-cysteine S-methyltransferase [Syntrophobacterales bacterium CG_4_8_14_3_um_filter_49_14]|nr:MAG: cysteine methyltransferase [Syntrophobacterales bacterium CG23_combo_of_CG06-09_8_20_14_all_48_27]PJC73319.1 MAG: methylated-DNA--[protein]-cysteine S-methyltransferase [Syntrophobacterales bacterium CG_4_8_14_3_um_filter_49_14]
MLSYVLTLTSFGEVGLVWVLREKAPSLVRIFLPMEGLKMQDIIHHGSPHFTGAVRQSHEIIEQISLEIQEYLSGAPVVFSFENLDMSGCNEFQRKVLLQNRQIPRGFISTYARLADKLSLPKGARAVGNALAGNPFPLIIPCHRVIRANGELGGYGGGPGMKRALLEMEGVAFGAGGRVSPACFW